MQTGLKKQRWRFTLEGKARLTRSERRKKKKKKEERERKKENGEKEKEVRGNEINNADETSNNCILCARPVSRSIYRSMKLPGLFLPRRKPFGVYGGVASPAMKIPFPRSPSPPFNRPRSQNFPSCSLPRGIKRNGPKGHRAFHALDIRLITFSLRFPRRRHDRLTRTTFPWEKKRKFLDGLPDRSRAKTRNARFLHSPRLRSSLRLPYVYLRLPCASPSILGSA